VVKVDLHCGDTFEVMATLADHSVDLLLVDLPYGTTACSWDSVLPLDTLWSEYYRICKPNAAMVFTSAQPFTTTLVASNREHFRYEWIWEKPQGTNPMGAKYMPLKNHENILVFYRERPVYNPQFWYSSPYSGFVSKDKKIGEVYGDAESRHRNNPTGQRYPKTVLKFSQERGLHPTQKPVPLMEYLIKTYSNAGDTVLDNTMGSGTTGVAAKQTDRNFIGIELNREYYDVAVDRIDKAAPSEPTPLLLKFFEFK